VGKVFRPEDMVKRKKMIDEAVQDLTPGNRELTKRILESWKDEESEKRLVRLLGDEETKRILRKVKF
jgi:Tfp pilus assembly major pilin PilA